MKKFLSFWALLLILLVPFVVRADENEFTIIKDTDAKSEVNVIGSTIVVGNNVTASNVVDGINMLFGNNVNYKSDSDYAVIAGNNVNVFGNIKNDGFIFGNLITFDSKFNSSRDVIIFGSDVSLKGNFSRNVIIYASSVTMENVVIEGNIKVYATNLDIKESSVIKGTLSHNEDAVKSVDAKASIGNVELLKAAEKSSLIYTFLIDYSGMLVIFLAMALIIPSLFKLMAKKNDNMRFVDLFSLFGFGALLLIFIPVLFAILLTTVIGLPLAIILLLFYIIAIWLSFIFSGYLLGLFIWNKFVKKDVNILLVGLIGISIICLLQSIPVIGIYITIISTLIGLGLIFKLFKRD